MTLLEQLARNREVYAALLAAASVPGQALPAAESPRRSGSNSVGEREAAQPLSVALTRAWPARAEPLSVPPVLSVVEWNRGEEAAPASAMEITELSLPAGEGEGPAAAAGDDVYDAFLRRHETEARRQSQLLTEEESL